MISSASTSGLPLLGTPSTSAKSESQNTEGNHHSSTFDSVFDDAQSLLKGSLPKALSTEEPAGEHLASSIESPVNSDDQATDVAANLLTGNPSVVVPNAAATSTLDINSITNISTDDVLLDSDTLLDSGALLTSDPLLTSDIVTKRDLLTSMGGQPQANVSEPNILMAQNVLDDGASMGTDALMNLEENVLSLLDVNDHPSSAAPSSIPLTLSSVSTAMVSTSYNTALVNVDVSASLLDVDATLLEGNIPMMEPDWDQKLTGRIQWMLSQNLQAADIQLDPPELGPLQIRVSVNQDMAQVVFASQSPHVRETLEQFGDRLKEQLAGEGLSLDLSTSSERNPSQQSDSESPYSAEFDFGIKRSQKDNSLVQDTASKHSQVTNKVVDDSDDILPSLDVFA